MKGSLLEVVTIPKARRAEVPVAFKWALADSRRMA